MVMKAHGRRRIFVVGINNESNQNSDIIDEYAVLRV
jgi:hypothetical protein